MQQTGGLMSVRWATVGFEAQYDGLGSGRVRQCWSRVGWAVDARLRWAGHVARMGESRNAYRVLVGRPEGKRPLGRPRRRWEDNIKMDLREVGYDDRDWINVAQDRDQWRAYVRAAMNLRRRADEHEISKEIKFRKCKWIGHVLRRENDNITKMALDWNPQGLNRRRGRPKITWSNTTRDEAKQAGKSWKEIKALANNRVRWRAFIKALCFPAE
ncbi:hypothetical protein ANN_02397 [Periplaneta americana]|uniref:Uncharacterized protein n=1 Tax=Periplaneta americana TaxID=6978 RepID=A0ABQ8TZ55_PERAM|nr:hypothetical protein ANN_02397 [Periplaneta americana]